MREKNVIVMEGYMLMNASPTVKKTTTKLWFPSGRVASPADSAGAMGEWCWRAPPLLPSAAAAGPRLTLPALPAGRCRWLHCAGADAQSQEGQG